MYMQGMLCEVYYRETDCLLMKCVISLHLVINQLGILSLLRTYVLNCIWFARSYLVCMNYFAGA